MGEIVGLPALVDSVALRDVRGDRGLQATWHDDDGVVVLSTWRQGRCVATVRLAPADAAALIALLADGIERHERGRRGWRPVA
ncbi:hypothetical protein Q9R32_14790 [Actinotalea sp. AC32]|nr:hypothetical protein [Actinotalea sp. AC32]